MSETAPISVRGPLSIQKGSTARSSRENTEEADSESSRSFGCDESSETDTTHNGLHSTETTNSDATSSNGSVTERPIQRTGEWLTDEGSSATDATIESDFDNITDYGLSVTDAIPGWQDKIEELKKPPGVPADIDHFNNRSVQRSRAEAYEYEPAGETQVPDSVREVISSSGQALDSEIQESMENRMGDSLGDVRIHTGAKAANACDSINARAFTVGNHVAFNHGEYDPSSPEGQHVLAHELAHVRQQTGGALSMLPQEEPDLEIDPNPALEREAEETAQRVMAGGEPGIQRLRSTEVHVQRMKPAETRMAVKSDEETVTDEAKLRQDINKVKEFAKGAGKKALGRFTGVGELMAGIENVRDKDADGEQNLLAQLEQEAGYEDFITDIAEEAAPMAADIVRNQNTGGDNPGR